METVQAAQNIPSWDTVEKRVRWFWKESFPEEKISEVKNPGTKPTYGSERVDNSLVPYRHVYIPGQAFYTRPDGSKWSATVQVAYYQLSDQSEWIYHNMPGGDPVQLEKATRVNPLKTTPPQVLALIKQYVDLMMKKNFPPYQSKEYYQKKAVEVTVTKVDFKDAAEAARWISQTENADYAGENKDARLSIPFVVEGTYKDVDGSFKFKVTNLTAQLYPNVQGGFWSLSSERKPLDQTDVNDVRGLSDALFPNAMSAGPRASFKQWAPKMSLRDQAMENLASSDANTRHDGITGVRFHPELYVNDEEFVRTLIKLLHNPEDRTEVKTSLDIIKRDTTKDSIKNTIDKGLEEGEAFAAKEGANAEEAKYQKAIKEFDQFNDINNKDRVRFSNEIAFLERLLKDEKSIDSIISQYEKSGSGRIRAWMEQRMMGNSSIALMSPAVRGKIEGVLNKEKNSAYNARLEKCKAPGAGAGACLDLTSYNEAELLNDANGISVVIAKWKETNDGSLKNWLESKWNYSKGKMSQAVVDKLGVGLNKNAPSASASAAPSMPKTYGNSGHTPSSPSPALNASPVSSGDGYAEYLSNLKDPKQARTALAKLKGNREYNEKLVKDDAAMDALIDIWLKKVIADSSTRSEVRSYLDSAKSYQKDKMSPETIKKIEDAFKAVRF